MLINRIVGAFLFRKQVYAEVEKDPSFTTTAWIIVAVVSLLSQLGARVHPNPAAWLTGALIGSIMTLAGFAVSILVINFVGKNLFRADVNYNELVRTLGLAFVWNILGVFNAGSLWLRLICLPLFILGWVLGLLAWLVAAKEALDLSWGKTILTVILGWLMLVIAQFVTAIILGRLGLGPF